MVQHRSQKRELVKVQKRAGTHEHGQAVRRVEVSSGTGYLSGKYSRRHKYMVAGWRAWVIPRGVTLSGGACMPSDSAHGGRKDMYILFATTKNRAALDSALEIIWVYGRGHRVLAPGRGGIQSRTVGQGYSHLSGTRN